MAWSERAPLIHIVHLLAQFIRLVRIGGAGMRRFTDRGFREFALAPVFHGGKRFVLRESRFDAGCR